MTSGAQYHPNPSSVRPSTPHRARARERETPHARACVARRLDDHHACVRAVTEIAGAFTNAMFLCRIPGVFPWVCAFGAVPRSLHIPFKETPEACPPRIRFEETREKHARCVFSLSVKGFRGAPARCASFPTLSFKVM
jgi:hypothetical protein